MTRRLIRTNEVMGVNINFREIDLLDRDSLREFVEEVKPFDYWIWKDVRTGVQWALFAETASVSGYSALRLSL